jgi:hypothetical protein
VLFSSIFWYLFRVRVVFFYFLVFVLCSCCFLLFFGICFVFVLLSSIFWYLFCVRVAPFEFSA